MLPDPLFFVVLAVVSVVGVSVSFSFRRYLNMKIAHLESEGRPEKKSYEEVCKMRADRLLEIENNKNAELELPPPPPGYVAPVAAAAKVEYHKFVTVNGEVPSEPTSIFRRRGFLMVAFLMAFGCGIVAYLFVFAK